VNMLTNKEHELLTNKFKEAIEEVSKDPVKAKAYLMQTGFYTRDGKLKDFYNEKI